MHISHNYAKLDTRIVEHLSQIGNWFIIKFSSPMYKICYYTLQVCNINLLHKNQQKCNKQLLENNKILPEDSAN